MPHRIGLVRFSEKGQANTVVVPRVGRKVILQFMCLCSVLPVLVIFRIITI